MNLKSSTSESQRKQQLVIVPAVLKNHGTPVKNVPVTAGVCLPKGKLSDAGLTTIRGFRAPVEAQTKVLNRWNDGSVRWMLVSFIAPEANGDATAVDVEFDSCVSANDPIGAGPLERTTTVRIVENGLHINCRDFTTDLPTEHILQVTPCLCGVDGDELPLKFDGIREEVAGPVRQVFVVNARLATDLGITFQFHLTYWASAGLLQIEARTRNTHRARHSGGLWDLGDEGSFLFRSLEISIQSEQIAASAKTIWRADRSTESRTTSNEVFLKQFGSGERFWSSSNHVTSNGTSSVRGRGFEAVSESGTLRGFRAEPTFTIESDGDSLAVAVPEFWQNFPASIASAMGILELGLFPADPNVVYELQGGEQKTHSIWLAVGSNLANKQTLDWVYDQPRFLQSPRSIQAAAVLPWFACTGASDLSPTAHNNVSSRFDTYLLHATSEAYSLDARRASIDEYGWRNFGDIPADHEQTHYAGSNTVVSHYNNQFDMIFGSILQLLTTSDLKWFDMMDPLARHVMDIDIYHTNADRAAFNGGLFWHTDHYVDARTSTHRTYSRQNQVEGRPYGGGPSCEHNYTTGLLNYHFLTGSAEARDSVLSLADWVIQMDDGRNTIFGLFDDGPTGLASATVFDDFHGPGRGAGNSVNALLDAWILTSSERYLRKAEELIRRCVHPSQNPDELHLLDAEGHWSYTVFLNSLGRYLLAKRDAEQFDDMYRYARDVMQTYGRWMATNERRTLDRPETLQYPTEAWAAQDFRKANALRIAASCMDDVTEASVMRQKADQINDASWSDFAAFGSASFTARCLSIVMTEGNRELFHRQGLIDPIPSCSATYKISGWKMFVPQKLRIKGMLKSPSCLIKASFNVFRLSRVLPAIRAFRRQL